MNKFFYSVKFWSFIISYRKNISGSAGIYTNTSVSTSILPSGTITGEWVQIKFPRRTLITEIFFTPQSIDTSVKKWTLLGTNNVAGTGWIPIYTDLTITFTTTAESALKGVLAPDNTIAYLYYRFVVMLQLL